MSSRFTATLALSALLPFALAACETDGTGDVLKDAATSIQAAAPPQQFQYTSASQTKYNPFTVDIWNQPGAGAGPQKSFVRVASPGISIGSPQHEAVARAVVVEVASERLCQAGTSPQFQQQYGRDVYLNERVQKWGAIVYCDTAPAFQSQQGPAVAEAMPPTPNQSQSAYSGSTVDALQAPMPPAPVATTQDTITPLPETNSPLPLSMMSSDNFQ
ncbi:hypothetical protein FP2506_12479 [Fulvimarina pelagi HTCC2506]|uniref:Lipoprotein n=2 Tax=Fulvimarina pelagi TaxID=217511 RepID=Q0G1K0_9HYPH|nr:hypothetical protein [Fulvimarina pelagi]EAU41081.1 hypothetical protein FP2506_12479 [Fulvimarina pelagi HTCC2506]BAT30905.1 hypothetical protein [Fulvimarina pelagi]